MTDEDDDASLARLIEYLTEPADGLDRLIAYLDAPDRPRLAVIDGGGVTTPPARPDLAVIPPDDSHKCE